LFRYFVNKFEMVPVTRLSTGITFAFIFHVCCIIIIIIINNNDYDCDNHERFLRWVLGFSQDIFASLNVVPDKDT
jgi:hypothetical protein